MTIALGFFAMYTEIWIHWSQEIAGSVLENSVEPENYLDNWEAAYALYTDVSYYNLQQTQNLWKAITLHRAKETKEESPAHLEVLFGYASFSDRTNDTKTYEALKTKGIDLISNDQLKREITKIYEFDIKLYIDENNRWEWAFSANTTQKMMLNHIRRKDAPEFYLAAPNDFDSLKDDVIFRNFLSVIIPIRNDHTDALVIVRKSFVNLLKGINEELEMLKK